MLGAQIVVRMLPKKYKQSHFLGSMETQVRNQYLDRRLSDILYPSNRECFWSISSGCYTPDTNPGTDHFYSQRTLRRSHV